MEKQEKRGIRERINDWFFTEQGFRNALDDYEFQGWITTEEKQKVLKSLDTRWAKKLMLLFLKYNVFSLVFNIIGASVSTTVGVRSASFWKGFWTYGGIFLVKATLNALYAFWYLRSMPDASKLALSNYIWPVGDLGPLYFLFKDHPEFAEIYTAYHNSRRSHKKRLRFHPDTPEYQRLITKEKKKFDAGMNRMKKTKRLTERVSNVVKKVIDAVTPKNFVQSISDSIEKIIKKPNSKPAIASV